MIETRVRVVSSRNLGKKTNECVVYLGVLYGCIIREALRSQAYVVILDLISSRTQNVLQIPPAQFVLDLT